MMRENVNVRQPYPFSESELDSPVGDGDLFSVEAGAGDSNVKVKGGWVHSAGKRFFDVTVASVGIVGSLPLLLMIALVIKTTSRGPVLFRQRRVGKGQVPFTIYKYRTMYTYSKTWGPRITRTSDCRMTTVGCLLRKLKLDELPQLFNVVRGDMSIVGPRPKLEEHERMDMVCRPGITGAATLVFAREEELLNHVPEDAFEEFTVQVLNTIKATLDTQHAESSTFLSDLRIIAQTVVASKNRKPVTSLTELYERYGDWAGSSSMLSPLPEFAEQYVPMLRAQQEPEVEEDSFMTPLSTYVHGDNAATAPY